MLFGRDRQQTREVFFRAWRRHRENLPLEGIESLIVAVARRHPEYQALLDNPAEAEDRNDSPTVRQSAGERHPNATWGATPAAANPFLHLGMHIAIEEQLMLDQPPGIRTVYQQLLARWVDEHAVQHRMMQCLGEWLWRAGRDGALPPETEYLGCLARLTGGPASG